MTNFYTSDLHIRHKAVAKMRWEQANPAFLRSCLTDEEIVTWHDQGVAQNWDDVVSKADCVWVLGDLALQGTKNIENALEWISARPGTKKLILGNHDAHPGIDRKSGKWLRRYLEVFDFVSTFARVKIDGQDVLLSHFPYSGDHTEVDRHLQWRLPDLGAYLLHGHTHSSEKISGTNRRQIHVGVDSWGYTPVSQDEIVKLIQ